MRSKGFMLGGTSGRTTLAGEGLQHQDGHSHLLAYPMSNLQAYDPAYAYELAVIIEDGLRRMYGENESVFYYLTVMNETYPMPEMPDGVEEGILRGIYRFAQSAKKKAKNKVNLLGSGTILNEAVKAAKILEDDYDVPADVYSVTGYKQLYWDAMECDRYNLLNPGKKERVPYVAETLGDAGGVFVAASDYVRALPASIAKWVPGRFHYLGTDGYGRSSNRARLRDFFEVDARYITLAALRTLHGEGQVEASVLKKAVKDFGIDADKPNPLRD
jgi:pyruvate dehydrogenase E1 component